MCTRHQLTQPKPSNNFTASSTVLALLVAMFTSLAGQLAQAQSFHLLHSFSGERDGANPYGGLLRDSAGNIYGTTIYGGSLDSQGCYGSGCGVAFKIDTAGRESVLYAFSGQASGDEPNAGLIRDSQGNLYGTTSFGGDGNCNSPAGCGMVFKVDAEGHQSVLYSFHGLDGARPLGALVRDAAGNLYGTTFQGGAANSGTVFKLDAGGNESVLYAFKGTTDGKWPLGALVLDLQGNLYGTTELGGDLSSCGTYGCGVVFKINASGGETVLYRFTGGVDGSESGGNLVRDSAGNLYGTTGFGGNLGCNVPYGCGVVFKVDANGVETVLHSFMGHTADGWNPIAGLVRDSSGNLYGTTYRGGAYGFGTVYKVDASGNESLLHSFSGGSDGSYPYAGVILDTAGNLYGAAVAGGKSGCSYQGSGCGVVFKIVP
jgi:uncharacterized repeat protein (TIGR03803 family)